MKRSDKKKDHKNDQDSGADVLRPSESYSNGSLDQRSWRDRRKGFDRRSGFDRRKGRDRRQKRSKGSKA